MRPQLLHCGRKLPVQSTYRILTHDYFSQLFLFLAKPCPHCQKSVVGIAGYDVWERPVYFDNAGNILYPDNAMTETTTGQVFATLNKKLTNRYLDLITNGQAQALPSLPVLNASTRGGMAGLSEFTIKAARRNSQNYILGIERIRHTAAVQKSGE